MPTIESNIHSIADSLKLIADLLTVLTANKAVQNAPIVQTPTPAPVQVAAPVTPIPVAVVAPSAAPVPAAPVMPTLPVFTTATVAPAMNPSPTATATTTTLEPVFKDKSAMMDFVLSSYKALGAEKGAKIQDVLTGLGYRNINDAPPETWGALKTGIESLKG